VQRFSRAKEATGLSNGTTFLFELSGVTVQRVEGASCDRGGQGRA